MSDKLSNIPVVLLVEDNQDDIFLAQAAITDLPYKLDLKVATDAMEALSLLGISKLSSVQQMTTMPQLILMDLKLPKTDGIEILTLLRDAPETRHIPIVMLTTSNEFKDVSASYREGANSYLLKPVDFDQFKHTLSKALDYWLNINIKIAPNQS